MFFLHIFSSSAVSYCPLPYYLMFAIIMIYKIMVAFLWSGALHGLYNLCEKSLLPSYTTYLSLSQLIKAGIGPTWVPWIKHNLGYVGPTLPFPHISLSIASRIHISHNKFCNFVTSACHQHNINILSAWKRINICTYSILFYSILFYSIHNVPIPCRWVVLSVS